MIKPQPKPWGELWFVWYGDKEYPEGIKFSHKNKTPEHLLAKARYQVGETVYIKEAFMFKAGGDYRERYVGTSQEYLLGKPPFYLYKLDNTIECQDYAKYYKWRSPMMMPERAARHFITITDVRAERVQEITEADAIAEGVKNTVLSDMYPNFNIAIKPASHNFRELWNSINKDYPWESNPWVFVYTFRLEGKGEE